MAINIKQELEKRYQKSVADENSLSARLRRIDEYDAQVNPQAIAQMTDFSNRPATYDSFSDIGRAIALSDRARTVRGNALQDFSAAKGDSDDILTKLAEMLNAEQEMTPYEKFVLERKGKAMDKQISDGVLKLNPKTGKLELSDERQLSDEGREALTLINEIMGRDTKKVTGIVGGILPWMNLLPEGQTTNAKIEQLKSKLALGARQLIKGTGQISDVEQKMLRDSVAALRPGMSDEDFRAELEKISGILQGNPAATSAPQKGKKGASGYTIERVE